MLDRIDKLEAQMREVMRRLPREAPAAAPTPAAPPSPSPFAPTAKPGKTAAGQDKEATHVQGTFEMG
jgi:hypothetical protein